VARARRVNGEGSIYQRASDGRWIGTLTVGWRDGKQLRKVVSAKSAREVQAKLEALRRTVGSGVVTSDKVTVDSLLDRWLDDVLTGQVAPNAVDNYRTIADHHLRPALGKRPVAKLTTGEIDHLLASKRASGLSVSTVRRIRSVLAQALTQAQRWEMVGRNVATLSTAPKQRRPEGRSLTTAQAQRLLKALDGHRLEALYVTMIGTGLRRGEALGLRWDDVDLKGSVLTVRHQLKREAGRLVLGDVKTERSRRAVNLPRFVVDALKAHAKRQKAERLAVGPIWRNTGYVFTTTIGTPIDPRNVGRDFASVTEAAGLGHWHPHELRHSAASLMLAQGVAIEVVSNVLGHSSIRLTADVYGHIQAAQRHAAAEAMEQALAST
jgi:integrase